MLLVLLTVTLTPALLAMPCVFGFYGSTLESLGAVAALRVSFSRIFTRAEFRRSMICATAVGTLAFGCSAVLGVFAILGLARWTAVYVAVDAVARTLLVPFVGLVLALYYFDVRIRHEGFDLESGLDRATRGGRGRRAGLCPDGLSLGRTTGLGRAFSGAPQRVFGLAARRARCAPCAARTATSTSRVARLRRRVAPGTTLKEVQGFLRSLPMRSRAMRIASALVRS